MVDEKKLATFRAGIDELDEQLLEVLDARARLVKQVADLKNATEKSGSFYRPEREAQILRKVIERHKGPLPEKEMVRLFREIMSACMSLEQTLDIAYLGPEGTFTHIAALKHFGRSVNTRPFGSIDQIFREVESGASCYGVAPVENSTEGTVNHTLDMLNHSSLLICGEIELRIHHHLLSRHETLNEIKYVYAHQQSLAQCRDWLDTYLVKADRIAVGSNVEAVHIAGRENKSAAIASEIAGELYKLNSLAKNIEDEPDNTTRFLVIGKNMCHPSGKDKTSLIFSASNKPGALYKMLNCFANNDINMTRIESRPSRREIWDYVFFVDIEGHVHDEAVGKALAELEDCSAILKLLGSYPCAVL